MKATLYSGIITIVVLLSCFCLWFSAACANQLTDVRMGEHGVYTRIVFEFKNTLIRHASPVKKNGERVTVVFPKGVAIQEGSFQPEIQKNRRIKSLVLNKHGQDLCADITMPSADFTSKLRYLPNPERVILDIYGETFIPEKVVTAISPKTEQTALPTAVTTMKQEARPQAPQSSTMLIYWSILMLINLSIVTILGLMNYALLKIKKRLAARWKNETPDLSDKGIFVIDSKIQEELKNYRGLSQTAQTAGT